VPLAPNVSTDLLRIDPEQVTAEITTAIESMVVRDMRKRGVVLGLSGGVDSSVCAALAARALGPERVLGLLMPERESSAETLELGRLAATSFGIPSVVEDISAVLDAAGCYARRDAAIQTLIPEYGPGWRCKVMLPSVVESDQYRIFSVLGQAPDGTQRRARVTTSTYLELISATSFKQRARKMMEYYHADRLNYAVIGTPNRLEYDQGFFVKNGDGAADLKPIAPGLSARRIPRRAGDHPFAAADDRHVFAAADPGGVLLLPSLRQDGPLPLCPEQRHRGERSRSGARADRATGRACVP
jgi:NAD+ synthase